MISKVDIFIQRKKINQRKLNVWKINWYIKNQFKNSTKCFYKGFMEDWMEPGTKERKMAGRETCFEIMSRIIHELNNLRPGTCFICYVLPQSAGRPTIFLRINEFSFRIKSWSLRIIYWNNFLMSFLSGSKYNVY